jgi:zinc transporter ZupT
VALAMLSASVTFFSTMFGGLCAIRWPKRIELLMALAGGVVLGAALFDLLPEAVSQAGELGISARVPIGAVLIGYLAFHAVDGYVHRLGHRPGPDPAGVVGASGFVVHSFFDGLAIGLAFQIDSGVGLLVAAAVIGHDFSDGLNTVSYLIAHRHPVTSSWKFLLADALAPVCGAAIALTLPIPEAVFPVALGFFSGFFIYAAATELLPKARALPGRQALPLTLAGASGIFLVSLFA